MFGLSRVWKLGLLSPWVPVTLVPPAPWSEVVVPSELPIAAAGVTTMATAPAAMPTTERACFSMF